MSTTPLWPAPATSSTPIRRTWTLCPPSRASPRKVAIEAPDAQTWAEELWANLNHDNKVSLFVQYIDLASGARETVIINKHG